MKNYILLWNDGVFYDGNKNVFNVDEIKVIFESMIEEFEIEGGFENLSIEEGIKVLIECEEELFVENEELCEMGDDSVRIKIIELKMKN